MRTLQGWILLAVCSLLALPLAAQRTVTFTSAGGNASGYLALPATPGPHAAVIVIQEWFGVNAWLKQQADTLAAQGYVALAPDLYHGHVATNSQEAMALVRGFDRARGLADLNAAYAYLRTRPDVEPNRIAAMGWCFGGGLAWSFADNQPTLRGVAIFYGPLPPAAERSAFIAKLKVPVLGSFGGADQSIPQADVEQFAAALKAAGKVVDIKIYPGMPHAFAHQTTPAGKAAYADAWSRTLAFLHQRLAD
jgi:carboxymethylenebutenolidase